MRRSNQKETEISLYRDALKKEISWLVEFGEKIPECFDEEDLLSTRLWLKSPEIMYYANDAMDFAGRRVLVVEGKHCSLVYLFDKDRYKLFKGHMEIKNKYGWGTLKPEASGCLGALKLLLSKL